MFSIGVVALKTGGSAAVGIATGEVLLPLSLTSDGVVYVENNNAGEMLAGVNLSSDMASGARSDEFLARQSRGWYGIVANFVDGGDVFEVGTGLS